MNLIGQEASVVHQTQVHITAVAARHHWSAGVGRGGDQRVLAIARQAGRHARLPQQRGQHSHMSGF